ncbi:MAG TPA: helix-turn-helix transcriptional regulator [Longimicrobium sp.]|nr:helix-turn-helix transcriptional regulator [Longimicrobium sp.]
MHSSPEVEFSSGNLWAYIGRPDAGEALARATLMSRAVNIIRERGLSVAGTAEVLKVDRPMASDLMRGKMSRFALERLIAFLNALDRDVEITVRRRPEGSNRAARFVVTSG